MADDCALGDFERIKHPDDIGYQLAHHVCLLRLRAIGFAIPALVGRDRAKARVRQRAQLMAPRVPQFGKAVAEHHRVSGAGLDQMHPDAVGVDELVGKFTHLSWLPRLSISRRGLQRRGQMASLVCVSPGPRPETENRMPKRT